MIQKVIYFYVVSHSDPSDEKSIIEQEKIRFKVLNPYNKWWNMFCRAVFGDEVENGFKRIKAQYKSRLIGWLLNAFNYYLKYFYDNTTDYGCPQNKLDLSALCDMMKLYDFLSNDYLATHSHTDICLQVISYEYSD